MDIEKLIAGIRSLINLMFGGSPPPWLFPAIGWLIGIGLLLLGINFVLGQIKKTWIEYIRPIFYNDEAKDRRFLRQRFADHVESEIRRLNNQENWRDYRFVELEAEVEFEGRRRFLGLFSLPIASRSHLTRERSLSRALEKSDERLILLEGDPGSGKSVALRHLAKQLARRSMSSRNLKSIIPIYVNLRELSRVSKSKGVKSGSGPNKDAVRDFVLRSVNRTNDRDISEFLEKEFDRGMREGTWLFLFDSFDEVPDILSSTEADNVVKNYAGAIDDFLHGMNQCRGIVASREYRGPRGLSWPRFRVLPLSYARRMALIAHSGLARDKVRMLADSLTRANTAFGSMIENPMFLGLLCDYARDSDSGLLPEHTHAVFENYVQKRLSRDAARLLERCDKSPEDVRNAAELVAFVLTAESELGLSPTRDELGLAMDNAGLSLGADYEDFLDALEFLKFARPEHAGSGDPGRTFAFSHRRFQEYFATCAVLRHPELVRPEALLTSAQWRETAVVILQSQREDLIKSVLGVADQLLEGIAGNLANGRDERGEGSKEPSGGTAGAGASGYVTVRFLEKLDPFLNKIAGVDAVFEQGVGSSWLSKRPFQWPNGLLHLLSILQEGLSGGQIPSTGLQKKARFILHRIFETGTVVDQKWALQVAGVGGPEVLEQLAELGLRSKSRWLKEAIYRHLARMGTVPPAVAKLIRMEIVSTALDRNLWRERREVEAYIRRLDQPGAFLAALRLMLFAGPVDHLIIGATITFLLWTTLLLTPVDTLVVGVGLALILINRWYLRNQEWLAFPTGILCGVGLLFAFHTWQVPALALVYAGAWGSGAILAAKSGRFLHPIWWPAYPVLAAFFVLRFIPFLAYILFALPLLALETVLRLPFRIYAFVIDPQLRPILPGLLIRLAIVLLILYSAMYGPSYLMRMGIPPVLAYLVAIPLFLVAWGNDIRNFVRDALTYRRWNRCGGATLDIRDFFALVRGVKHHGIRSRIIRSIRTNNLLEGTAENLLHLTTLLLLAEGVVGLGPQKRMERFFGIFPRLQEMDRAIESWLATEKGLPRGFVSRWDSEDMDELARLVESVKERSH